VKVDLTRPVFLGDDVTDEYGFAMVNRLRGHSFKVGVVPTVARWRLGDARGVREWLARGLASAGLTAPDSIRDREVRA
jgi:trehalose 6-phosphate phosphatase